MKEIKGKPEENSIEKFAIRSMSKARYSTEKEKHFGLAFKNYSHFTSPIRRFPDVMVHRLLQYYINGSKPKDKLYYDILCKHCSKMEINATKAERESIKYKQAEYMANFIGQEFEGVISGITEWGIYVEIVKNCSKEQLMPIIQGKILEGSTINTDGWKAYDGLILNGYTHHRVFHLHDEFARGKCHVNGIESFWSFCKRRLAKFNGLSDEKFLLHLKESEFRFNNRKQNLYKILLEIIRKNPLN